MGEQQQQEGPIKNNEATEKKQQEGEPQADVEMLMKQLQEKESQAIDEVQILKQQLQEKEAQIACMASWEMKALQCRQPAISYALYLKDQMLH